MSKLDNLLNELRESAGSSGVTSLIAEGYGTKDPSDMMKSLNSLVKYNGGLFKSAAQARFLYRGLDDPFYHAKPIVKAWAKPWMNDRNSMAIETIDRIAAFGSKTAHKVRYYGFAFVIDGGGVVAAAKLKVVQGRGKETNINYGGQVAGVGHAIFERTGEAPVLYDAHGVAKEKEARAQNNAPLIARIQSVPTYQNDSFLQSLVAQLQTGGTLSPSQERVLSQKMPHNMQSRDKYKQLWADGLQIIDRIVREVKEGMVVVANADTVSKLHKEASEYFGQRVVSGWEAWKKRPSRNSDIMVGGTSNLASIVGELGWTEQKKSQAGGGYWTLGYLWAVGQLAAKGEKAAKNATKMARGGEMLVDVLRKIPAGAAKRHYVSSYLEKQGDGSPAQHEGGESIMNRLDVLLEEMDVVGGSKRT